MDQLLERLAESWRGPFNLTVADLLLSTLCALICGFVIAETYRRSHRGVGFSRSFLQVLILLTLLVAFVTLVVGDDLARAFTLVGALSVVRFRTAVKEARDLGFIFWAVAVGMGAGCRFVSLTVLFTVFVAALVWALTAKGYGVRDVAVRVLRVRLDSSADYDAVFKAAFDEHLAECERISVGLVRQGLLNELVFLVRLKEHATERRFLEDVRKAAGDNPVTLTRRDSSTEL